LSLRLRPGIAADAPACGAICYSAFASVAERHGFPPDFPSAEVASGILSGLLGHPGFYSVVAEEDGTIIGSNFLDERSPVAGIGPITVDPTVQNRQIGRTLMNSVLDRAEQQGFGAVRLLQATYHARSLSLYTKLGFESRELVAVMQGDALNLEIAGYSVRAAVQADLDSCDRLCKRVHGHHRSGELTDAIGQGAATVVERNDRITGYSTGMAFFAHSVAETNDDMKALIGAASAFHGPGILVPTRNGELFRWCLERGLRVVLPTTLMTVGLYNEPAGAYMPSILY